ncbi:hypothetical protein D3C72_1452790 [compost metagenome]
MQIIVKAQIERTVQLIVSKRLRLWRRLQFRSGFWFWLRLHLGLDLRLRFRLHLRFNLRLILQQCLDVLGIHFCRQGSGTDTARRQCHHP